MCRYNKDMQRTYVYLPDELIRQIEKVARLARKSKSEVIREALAKGIQAIFAYPHKKGK